MKPHLRRGRKAKKIRQDRADLRFKAKPADGNLSENSDLKIISRSEAKRVAILRGEKW